LFFPTRLLHDSPVLPPPSPRMSFLPGDLITSIHLCFCVHSFPSVANIPCLPCFGLTVSSPHTQSLILPPTSSPKAPLMGRVAYFFLFFPFVFYFSFSHSFTPHTAVANSNPQPRLSLCLSSFSFLVFRSPSKTLFKATLPLPFLLFQPPVTPPFLLKPLACNFSGSYPPSLYFVSDSSILALRSTVRPFFPLHSPFAWLNWELLVNPEASH